MTVFLRVSTIASPATPQLNPICQSVCAVRVERRTSAWETSVRNEKGLKEGTPRGL